MDIYDASEISITTSQLEIREVKDWHVTRIDEIAKAVRELSSTQPRSFVPRLNPAKAFYDNAQRERRAKPRKTCRFSIWLPSESKLVGTIVTDIVPGTTREDHVPVSFPPLRNEIGDIVFFVDPAYEKRKLMKEAFVAVVGLLMFEELEHPYVTTTVDPNDPLVVSLVGDKKLGSALDVDIERSEVKGRNGKPEPRRRYKIWREPFLNSSAYKLVLQHAKISINEQS